MKEKRNAFPVHLASGQRSVVWIDLFVPPDATAGVHTLTVRVTASSGASSASTEAAAPLLTLEVAPFALPSTSTLATAFGGLKEAAEGHGLCTAKGACHPGGNALVQRYADAMLMHKLSGDVLQTDQMRLESNFSDWATEWGTFFSGRTLPFGLTDARLTTQSLPAPFCVETVPIKLPHETKVAGFNCTSTPALTTRQRTYWKTIYANMKQRGWEKPLFDYTVDEPSGCGADDLSVCVQRWQILHDRAQLVREADPRIRTMVTAEIEVVKAAHPALLDSIDIWSPTINTLDGRGSHASCTMMGSLNGKKIAKNVSTIGDYRDAKVLWMYQACPSVGCGGVGCGNATGDKDPGSGVHSACIEGWPAFFAIDHPAVSQRIMQWADFTNDVSGELYWGVLGQYGRVKRALPQPDPALLWRDQWTNGANGDGNLFYPGTSEIIGGKTHVPVESLRLKFLRDGVEDFDLLRLAERHLGRDAVLRLIRPTFINLGDWTRDAETLFKTRRALGKAVTAALKVDDHPLQPTPPTPPVPADAVFKPGEAGYACFRAPSLTYTANGERLLAIVEAYKFRCVSRQWCDIAQKVSSDNGRTWSAVSLVHGTGGKGDGNTSSPCFQNVAPTVDHITGELFLPLHAAYFASGTTPAKPISTGTAVVMVSSTDGGRSYSVRGDVSAEFGVKGGVPSMPGGTQLLPSGRLIAPVYREGLCPSKLLRGRASELGRRASGALVYCAYLVLSDDHGKSWWVGAEAVNGSECQATTLANGSVLLNMRDSSPSAVDEADGRSGTRGGGLRARRMALSNDGGETFAHQWLATGLPDPVVEGSTVRIPGENRLLFSHPSLGAGNLAPSYGSGVRQNMSLFASDEGGALGSWKLVQVVQPGPSAYSSIAVLPNKTAALVLYEGGDETTNGDPCQGPNPCWQALVYVPLLPAKSDDADYVSVWPNTSVGIHSFLTCKYLNSSFVPRPSRTNHMAVVAVDDGMTSPAAIRAGANAYGFVWGAAGKLSSGGTDNLSKHVAAYRSVNPSIVLSSYMSFIDDSAANGSRVAWKTQAAALNHWNVTHPDWILYKCDRKTPTLMPAAPGNACEPPGNNAHGECQVHVDFSNPEVQEWQFEQNVPQAAALGYDAMAIDNFDLIDWTNLQQACGVWRGGEWDQLYSGEQTDPAWLAAVTSWLGTFTARVNKVTSQRGLPMQTVVNFDPASQSAFYHTGATAAAAAIANAVDAVLCEAGWDSSSIWQATSLWNGVSAEELWTRKLAYMEALQAKGKAHLSINCACRSLPTVAAHPLDSGLS